MCSAPECTGGMQIILGGNKGSLMGADEPLERMHVMCGDG